MPFTEPERRAQALAGTLKEPERGDFCFLAYRPMILAWKAELRWTTADKIYEQYLTKRASLAYNSQKMRALDLAWQVFFGLHVLPYEVKKRKENGEVE